MDEHATTAVAQTASLSATRTEPLRGKGCSEAEAARAATNTMSGNASYYHDSLAGSSTASGEPYQPSLLTAAHRTLPLGTRVRVTRADVATKSIVCVTVNDRGPYAGEDRVIDLSRAAAEALGMTSAGVVPVRVDVLAKSGS